MARREMEAVAGPALRALGFARRGELWAIETSPETLGTLGLMGSTKYFKAGEVEVQPVVGSAHLKVEAIVAELRGEPKKRHVPATVNSPLYALIDRALYQSWMFVPSAAHSFAHRLSEAVREYAIPYMERLNTLEAICAELEVNSGPESAMHACRRAVVSQLLGDDARARSIIDEELRRIERRTGLAAETFRTFAGEFSRRFPSSSA